MNKQLLEVAWKCWNESITSSPITVELVIEESDDWKIINEQVQFNDEETVFKYAAQYVYEEIIIPKLESDEDIYNFLRDIWLKQISNRSLAGKTLAIAHNNGVIDLFEFAISIRKYQHSTFEFLQVIDDAISGINHLNYDTVFEWHSTVSIEMNRGWGNGYLIEALVPFLKEKPDARNEIYRRYFEKPEQSTASLYKLALISAGQIEVEETLLLTRKHIELGVIEITIPAVDSFSYYSYALDSKSNLLTSTIDFVSQILKNTEHNDLKGIAASTICRLVVKNPLSYRYLLDLAAIEIPQIKDSIANFLLQHVNDFRDQNWIEELILSCSRVSVSEMATLKIVDYVLYKCLSLDVKIVEHFLEQWLRYQEQLNFKEINLEKIFDSTIYALLDTNRIPSLFTRWMGSDSVNLNYAADHLIQSLYVNRKNENSDFEFDLDILNSLDLQSIDKLVHRCFGYLFDQHKLLSLTWSLTKISNNQHALFRFVEELFLIHLSYDYPADSKEFLEKKLKAPLPVELQTTCHKVIKAIDSYQEKLHALPKLKEMESSDIKRNFIFRERDKQMHKSRVSAQRESVMAKLATSIHLKFGQSSFSVHGSRPTEKMQMYTHSISYSLPRSEVIDPVGINRMRFIYRSSFKVEK